MRRDIWVMFGAITRTLSKFDPHVRAETELSFEADAVEEAYGAAAVAWVRGRILKASRTHRPHLYRLHDELVRRRGYDVALSA